ncbi:class III lanthionine synthetase LanKC [Streptomyces acidiscabies]|uniref:class III lanthionine synthetase LanKC n=1 Tax=Streptomyces acidiscabies TaxID=42234 RepID=UPI00067B25F2|nr:class III lanthionine synthetase LanKC [Streptomyces acidiscabies]
MDAYRRVMFLAPGTPFFDRTEADTSDPDDDFLASEPPADWSCHTGTDWTMLTPHGYQLPAQGWKVHVSATSENARTVLDRSWEWLVEQRMAFKFIRSRQVLSRRNGKYGDRGASGKFITIYPEDEARLASVLGELGELLDGERGPYILSDLRWRSGPLYVRYGGFVARVMKTAKGETVPCIEDPEGRLVPDVRGPSFRPPEWVTIPECLAPAMEARNAGTLHDFPYRAERALHFSNGGGVYRGTDTRTGEPVLLREARPLAGIDTHGEDAVARLVRERDCLERLAGLPWVPRLIEARVGHEHHFLVREFVEGETLAIRTTRDNPASPSADPSRTADYTRWAIDALNQIDEGIQAMHARGVIFGDLHPGNIMVRPDDSIAFIDLETATTDLTSRQIHAAPGFAAPPTHRGTAIDRYALGCLRIALFTPLTSLLAWGPEKLDQLIDLIESTYPVPGDFGAKVRADLGAAPEGEGGEVVGAGAQGVVSGEDAAKARVALSADSHDRSPGERLTASSDTEDQTSAERLTALTGAGAQHLASAERSTAVVGPGVLTVSAGAGVQHPALAEQPTALVGPGAPATAVGHGIPTASAGAGAQDPAPAGQSTAPAGAGAQDPASAERPTPPVSSLTSSGGAAALAIADGAAAPAPTVDTPSPTAIAQGILTTATPTRQDRLYPGDTAQFLLPEGGTCLAYGAAGVLWALAETGVEIPAAHVDWLADAAQRTVHLSPGLYTGTSGVACALHRLGRTDTAAELLKDVGEPLNDTLLDGRAGLALAQLYFARATGDDDALKQATLLAERLVESAAGGPPRRGEAGLLRGRAGTALLLLRLHDYAPDSALLDAAHDLLDADLRALGWTDDGWTPGSAGTRPTFAAGSGGTAMVLKEYLAQHPDAQYELACDTVLRSALDCVPHTAGLFHGFAGVLLTATRLGGTTQARQLRLYEVPHEGMPAFLGLENVRLTTDLATGAAGVLLARSASTPLAFL